MKEKDMFKELQDHQDDTYILEITEAITSWIVTRDTCIDLQESVRTILSATYPTADVIAFKCDDDTDQVCIHFSIDGRLIECLFTYVPPTFEDITECEQEE